MKVNDEMITDLVIDDISVYLLISTLYSTTDVPKSKQSTYTYRMKLIKQHSLRNIV